MKRNILFLLLFLVLYINFGLYSQEARQPVNILSPDVASLGRYGDVPVSYYTGTPNINIPLYSLNVNGIELNVELNYDATGVRVNQHPGWVGQNWSLSAGGVITRTVIGDDDEFSSVGCGGGSLEYDMGYMYRGSDLNENDLEDDDQLKNYAQNRTMDGYDYEPDIFTFNFMGKTGKFFLGEDGNWKVSSNSNLKVIMKPDLITPLFEWLGQDFFNEWKYPKVIGGFELIDDQGTIYKFGYDTTAIEYSISFFHQVCLGPAKWTASAWHLTSVTDKYGNELYSFTYGRKQFIANLFKNIVSKRYSLESNCNFWQPGCLVPGCSYYSSIKTYNIGGNLILPAYLTKIESLHTDKILFFINETNEMVYDYNDIHTYYYELKESCPFTDWYWIFYLQQANPYITEPLQDDFLDNLKWYKLYNISISNSNTSYVKRIHFNYNNDSAERLCLKSIDFRSNYWDPFEKFSYSFSYDRFDQIPEYLSRKVDHWGFNKGTAYSLNSGQLIDNHYEQRESNSEYTSIGILNLIIYPTGGWTYFQYEPNNYSQVVSNDRSNLYDETGEGGGLRIKKIINYDGNKTETREFIYESNFNGISTNISSGILKAKPKYYWDGFHLHWYDGGNVDYYAYTFSNNSLIPLSNSFGIIIGYSEVVEKRNNNGYTIYKYSNYDNSNSNFFDEQPINTFNSDASIYDPYSKLALIRGKLIEVTNYNEQNENVLSKKYTYRTDHTEMRNNFALATNVHYITACASAATNIYFGNAYKLYYFDYDIIEEEVINYIDGNQLIEQTSYVREDINNIRLLKAENFTTSKNEIIKTEYFYPRDLPSEQYMDLLINNDRNGEVIRTVTTIDNQPIGFKTFSYKLENDNIVPELLKESKTDENGLFVITYYDKYDEQGNLLQFHNNDNYNISFIRGYYNRHIIAKIENENYSSIEPFVNSIKNLSNDDNWHCFNSTSCDETLLRNELDNLRINFPNAQIFTYTYDPGVGLTSITEPNGQIIYYGYDKFNRLETIRDKDEYIIKHIDYQYYDLIEFFLTTSPNSFNLNYYAGSEQVNVSSNINWIVSEDSDWISILPPGSGAGDGSFSFSYNHNIGSCNSTRSADIIITAAGVEEIISITQIANILPTKFININENQGNNPVISEADLQATCNDIITMEFMKLSTSNNVVSVQIGDLYYYNIENYQTYTVEVSIEQALTYCMIKAEGAEYDYVWLKIIAAQNPNTVIVEPKILELSKSGN
jgi:hypothetical protein